MPLNDPMDIDYRMAFNMAPVAGDLLKSNVGTLTPSGTAFDTNRYVCRFA